MNAPLANNATAVQPSGGRSIEDLISNVSASRLACFQQCRLKFMFRYVLGLVKPKSAALHVGTAVHAVLKHWNMARWKEQTPSLKALHDAYSAFWSHEQEESPVVW